VRREAIAQKREAHNAYLSKVPNLAGKEELNL
jgi:hypothetical protein